MNDNEGAAATVIAVLLADGWHQIVPGSFSVGPLGLGGCTDLGLPGFRFEEAEAGRPYRPTVLAGPLDSIIAVRHAPSDVRHRSDLDRARAPHNGHQADQGAGFTVASSREPLAGGEIAVGWRR
jgi:hypothetical protein